MVCYSYLLIKYAMGSSVSKNVADNITKIISKTANEILSVQEVGNNQSLIIKISDTGGDVIINGNRLRQTANVDVKQLQTALTNNEANNKLNQDIAQAAKSAISGLNLLQFSNASNTINTLIESCIEIKNTTIQQCLAKSQQSINIIIERTQGNVRIENMESDQITNIIASCVQSSVTNNKALQDIVNKISQAASAKSEGLSLVWIAIIILLVIIGGGVFTVAGGGMAVKLMFPAMILGSIISGVLYFTQTSSTISSYGFCTALISDNKNCDQHKGKKESFKSATLASEACMNDPKCTAYEWYNNNAVLYTDTISQSCSNAYTDITDKDKSPVLSTYKYEKGESSPSADIAADYYLNTTTGDIWEKKTGQWTQLTKVAPWKGGTFEWGSGPPPSDLKTATIYVDYTTRWYYYWEPTGRVWLTSQITEETRKLPVGVSVDAKADESKYVGFKEVNKRQWLLYLSIGLMIVGVLGTGLMFGLGGKGGKKQS